MRLADLPDSRLIARKVAGRQRLICASPAYLVRSSAPVRTEDVAGRDCLCFTGRDDPYRWEFRSPCGDRVMIAVRCRIASDDATLKDAVLGGGVYPMPIGTAGTLMVDTRDLAEVAAIDLMRRDASTDPLPIETIDVVDPEVLSGPGVADIWSQLLGRTVTYGGDDLDVLEQSLQQFR